MPSNNILNWIIIIFQLKVSYLRETLTFLTYYPFIWPKYLKFLQMHTEVNKNTHKLISVIFESYVHQTEFLVKIKKQFIIVLHNEYTQTFKYIGQIIKEKLEIDCSP